MSSSERMASGLIKESKGIALRLTIDRPAQRNALSLSLIVDLESAIASADDDPSVRCIVLTGSGHKAFCSGADLSQGGPFENKEISLHTEYANLLRQAIKTSKPIIARVNGACLAGGMGLLGIADIAVASPAAVFGLPEVKVGVFPMQALTVLQPHLPLRVLSEMCLTGESISAQEALELHLVNYVSDRLDEKVDLLVEQVGRNSPAAIRRGIYAMKRTRSMAFEESMSFMESQIHLLTFGPDLQEGLAAFREKRAPAWTDS